MARLNLMAKANFLLNKIGIGIIKIPVYSILPDKTMLNIGSGDWECKGWANLDYPTQWYANAQRNHKIIPYDIRNDNIPFEDDSVDAIYCSHVVEHIEDKFIVRLFSESNRVLKKNSVLRIACPDAEFLYLVSKFNNNYWSWRNEWFSSPCYYAGNSPRTVDFLVREIATPKLLGYINGINNQDYADAFSSMDMYGFLNYLTNDLQFRESSPGDHINYWTFEKMFGLLNNTGFDCIIRSKWNASVCEEMRLTGKFDTTYPVMSLYVEAVK